MEHMHKMIGRIGLVALVMLGGFFITNTPAHAATNLITNGNLETAMTTDAARPQGWTSSYWGTITGKFTYPVAGKGGGKAAQVLVTKYTSGDAKWYFNHVAVTPGTPYQFSEDYTATVATNITAEFKLSNGTYSYVWLGDAPASTAWKTFSVTVTPPAGAVSVSIMHALQKVGTLTTDNFSLTSGTTTPPTPPVATSTPIAKPVIASFIATPASILVGSSSVLSWNVAQASSTSINQNIGIVSGTSKAVNPTQTMVYVLTATNPGGSSYATTTVTVTTPPAPPVATSTPTSTPSGNLVKNGNLETAMTTDAARPQGWTSSYWGTITGKFTYPVAGKGGGKAAQVLVTKYTSGDAKWAFDHIPVSSNTVYQFTEDYMSNVVSNVTVEFLMSDNTYQYLWIADPASTNNAWSSISSQITVPQGAVSMTILHALVKVGTLTIDNVSVVALPSNPFPQGMVTLAFDDGLLSQYQNARPILNTAGIKGGYYIITTEPASGDSEYMTWAQIKTLKTEGNEVGGHTRTHADLTALTASQATAEIKGSYDDLVAQGLTPKAFVYPLGAVNPSVEQLVKNAGYTVARGSYWGFNTPTSDKYDLYDIRLDNTTTFAAAKAWIDQAISDKRWLVLELHDVLASGGDEYAITPALFQQIVSYIKSSGIKPVTLEQGLGYMQ
ncbi:MAG TPA: polysaccharide deacetylase family protein [Candidatus Paceibacterota bacterium]|nr:polysaccharide deacetylase family protein [Candidatus Paceibacterota bacterium]